MESQLLRLRSHLLSSAPVIVEELDLTPSSPKPDTFTSVEHPSIFDEALPAKRPERDYHHHRRRRYPTMGDAEAEHLLLAGRRLSAVRRVVRTTQPVPREEDEDANRQGDEMEKPTRSPARQRRRRASDNGAAAGRGGEHVEGGSPQTTLGAMSELLQAAQTVLTRQASPEVGDDRGEPSPKRRRMSSMPGATFGGTHGSEDERAKKAGARGKRVRRRSRGDDVVEEDEPATGEVTGETTPKASAAPVSSTIMTTPTSTSAAATLFKQTTSAPPLSPTKSSPDSSHQNRVFSALDVLADQAAASQQSSASTGCNEEEPPSPSPQKRQFSPRQSGRRDDPDWGAVEGTKSGGLGDPFMLRTRSSGSGPFHQDMDPSLYQLDNRGPGPREAAGSPSYHADSPGFGYSSASTFGMPAPQTSTSASIAGVHFPNLSPTLNPLGLPPPSHPPPHLQQNQTTPPQQHGRRLAPAPAPPQSASQNAGGGGGTTTPGATSSTEEAKRQRSPYVKWNLAEDELLVKAVVEHGQRWDSVSKLGENAPHHLCIFSPLAHIVYCSAESLLSPVSAALVARSQMWVFWRPLVIVG
jgi:hypothetical protein